MTPWRWLQTFWQGRRIPLAWLLLTRQPVRLAVALAGISFAGILMFMQLGFRDGLFDASVTIHRLFDADLVLISPRSTSSVSMAGFPACFHLPFLPKLQRKLLVIIPTGNGTTAAGLLTRKLFFTKNTPSSITLFLTRLPMEPSFRPIHGPTKTCCLAQRSGGRCKPTTQQKAFLFSPIRQV